MNQIANSNNSESMTAVRAEVDRVLDCIAKDADHYALLNVKRDAGPDEIRQAYCRAVEMMHPYKWKDALEADGVMRWKLSQAILHIVEAFSVLSRSARRIEYDAKLKHSPRVPLPMPPLPDRSQINKGAARRTAANSIEVHSEAISFGSLFGHQQPNLPKAIDRRKTARFTLRIPVRVTYSDWQEVTETLDLSNCGARLLLTRSVQLGDHLHLEMPMPVGLRNHSHRDAIYSVKSIVRYARQVANEEHLVGVEFLMA